MKLQVTEKARKIFKESTEDPYLRVHARAGGCSGWTFVLESDTDIDSTDSMFDDFAIINTELHENIIGDLMVDYRDDNLVEQGFCFKRLSTGVVCGCGESFTPLNSNKPLGW
jgi:iron-sulfur cluster assembly protein